MSAADIPEWYDDALCAQTDPEAFFPGPGGSTREAKLICNGDPKRDIAPCPVRAECLAWAMETKEQSGIYGGLSPRERLDLRNKEAAA